MVNGICRDIIFFLVDYWCVYGDYGYLLYIW